MVPNAHCSGLHEELMARFSALQECRSACTNDLSEAPVEECRKLVQSMRHDQSLCANQMHECTSTTMALGQYCARYHCRARQALCLRKWSSLLAASEAQVAPASPPLLVYITLRIASASCATLCFVERNVATSCGSASSASTMSSAKQPSASNCLCSDSVSVDPVPVFVPVSGGDGLASPLGSAPCPSFAVLGSPAAPAAPDAVAEPSELPATPPCPPFAGAPSCGCGCGCGCGSGAGGPVPPSSAGVPSLADASAAFCSPGGVHAGIPGEELMAGGGGFHAPGGGFFHAPIVAAGAVSCCCGRLGGDHAPTGVLPSRGAGPVRSSIYHDKNRRCIGTSQLTRQNKQIQLTTHPDRRARSRIRSRRASSPCAARPSPAARRS
eukprot:COSAG01_NODE_15785_length_1300_cov_1.394671_1_plen_381_part_01